MRKARVFFVPHGNLAMLYYKLQGVQNHLSSYFNKLWYLFPFSAKSTYYIFAEFTFLGNPSIVFNIYFLKKDILHVFPKLSTKAIKIRYVFRINRHFTDTNRYVCSTMYTCNDLNRYIVHLSVNSATRPNEHIML